MWVQIGSDRELSISPTVVFEVLEGEAIVLEMESGTYFRLNGTGTRVWQLIEEHGDPGAVERAMVDGYEGDPGVITTEVRDLVGELKRRGLIVES